MDIKAYFHCKTCGIGNKLEVGLTDPTTLMVRCTNCDKDVGAFQLAKPIQPRCDVCGEDIGPGHLH